MLSTGSVTHCTDDFPATLKPARRIASNDDILASDITKHALRLRATEYWQAASSLDALNYVAQENFEESRSKKTATTYAAVQLWRSIVINLEQKLRAKYNSRLSLRRMLCLHPQYSGSQILDCLLEYLTAAVGRHMLVDKRHGRLICLKLLKSGVIENAKDSSCNLFNEASVYRFTGRQGNKVSKHESILYITLMQSLTLFLFQITEKRVTIIDPKTDEQIETGHFSTKHKFSSFWKQPEKPKIIKPILSRDQKWKSCKKQPLHFQMHNSRVMQTRKLFVQRQQIEPFSFRHSVHDPQGLMCRSKSLTSMVAATDNDAKWILYGYV